MQKNKKKCFILSKKLVFLHRELCMYKFLSIVEMFINGKQQCINDKRLSKCMWGARSISLENITKIDDRFAVPYIQSAVANALFCSLAMPFYAHNLLIINHLPPPLPANFSLNS
jgi:hypothetical protein